MLAVRSPIFGGVVVDLNLTKSVLNFLTTFVVDIPKFHCVHFRGLANFSNFFSEPRVAAHSTSARFRGLRITEKVSKELS